MSKWIPTSERHPNHAGEYLVTMIGINGKREVGIVKFRLDGRNKQPFFYNPFTQTPLRVTAWMRIPDPYEEGREKRD